MKKLASMIAGLAALAAAPAVAADMPVKYVPPAPPPVFSWSGCYVGLHVGAGWQVSNFTGGEVVTDTLIPSGPTESGIGWLGGGQAGCNVQWQAFVIGLEGEVWGSTLHDRFFDQFGSFTAEANSRNRWDAAISVRSGVAFDRAFVYGKLGAVWGKFDYDEHVASGFFFSASSTGSATITGVLIGVGFEYALTDNWTTKFEYNYIDYGNKIVEFAETECIVAFCVSGTFRQTVKERKQLAKLGINYKFGVGKEPALRARY
jgi:outer membrane immunogenic protein